MSTPSISHYLSQYDKWAYNLALKSQWLFSIDSIPGVDLLQQITSYESRWIIDQGAQEALRSQDIQNGDIGCFFIDKVTVIGDGSSERRPAIGGEGGFIAAPTVSRRKDFNRLVTSFKETNSDFIEAVIRPWIILGGFYGSFAYKPDGSTNNFPYLKTNITLISFARYNTSTPIQRKIYRFYNAMPIEVDATTYTYNEDSGTPETREIGWIFDRYSVEIGGNV